MLKCSPLSPPPKCFPPKSVSPHVLSQFILTPSLLLCCTLFKNELSCARSPCRPLQRWSCTRDPCVCTQWPAVFFGGNLRAAPRLPNLQLVLLYCRSLLTLALKSWGLADDCACGCVILLLLLSALAWAQNTPHAQRARMC